MTAGWRRADLEADVSWRHRWSANELDGLFRWASPEVLAQVTADPATITALAGSAPDPLKARATQIRTELIDGRGLIVMSGFPVSERRPESVAAAFLLFGSLVGSPRSQNSAGHILGHVTDTGADISDPDVRIYQTNRRQTFHTDSSDAVALLCLRPAKSGGASMVVSVDAVHSEMVQRSPRLAERLFEPVATDRRGEQPPGELPWFEIPVFTRSGDRVTGMYQRQYIDSCSRFQEAPAPDAEYIEALDLLDAVMNDPQMFVEMDLYPGDIQFVHNHSLMHDRSGFVDHDDPARRRHLLRLWLSVPGDRELPEVFAQRYGTVTVGDRGGIVVDGTEPTIPLTV